MMMYAGLYGDIQNLEIKNFRDNKSGYTGEIIIKFKPTPYRMTGSDQFENSATEYDIGDRVAQLIITKCENIHFEVTEHLDNSERSSNGFGSSDKNVKNV